MRMASDSSLWIPATMWQSFSCGMTLLSAMDFIPSVQSFPSRALTTAGQGIIHSHIKCTYPASSTANTWSEYQQKILSRHKHPGRLRRSQLYCGYCYWSSFTINFTKRRSVLLFQGTYSNRHNIIRLFSSCYFFSVLDFIYLSVFFGTTLGPHPSSFLTMTRLPVVFCLPESSKSPLNGWKTCLGVH